MSKCVCGKYASFGPPGGKPTHCKKCKTFDMNDIKNKKCPCGKTPNFGVPGERPVCCVECKESGMKDIKSKRCTCGKQPSFGFKGKRPVCCVECKEDGMENVVNEKCPCGKQPSFGFPGCKKTRCGKCKEGGMVNVVSKRCPCGKIPSFGIPGGKATHCSKCMVDGMKDVANKKCPCGRKPHFGFPCQKPTHCSKCKEDGMEDVLNRRCQGFGSAPCPSNKLISGHEYCLECDPDESRRLARKRDEAAFFNFLKKNDIAITQQHKIDFKRIDTNRKRAYIDGIIIANGVIVCLELDEDVHETYDKTYEKARMHNVSTILRLDYSGKHIAWVRVNPHTKKDGKRDISSKAKKIRAQRHQEALIIVWDILKHPRDCIEYVGYY
jgi:hypothetical protein